MQVTIANKYAFIDPQLSSLTFSHEVPGGDISASFVINMPAIDIDIFDEVTIYASSAVTPVWCGFVVAIDREKAATKVECAGWSTRLSHLVLESSLYLDNEKVSTFISDHILPMFSDLFHATYIDTSDATIEATREYQIGQTYRAVLDDVCKLSGYTWFVRGRDFYYRPLPDYVSYRIHPADVTRSTDATDFANRVAYTYRQNMAISSGSVADDNSPYPTKTIYSSFGDIDGTTAATAASAQLALRRDPTGIGEITTDTVTDVFGTPVSLPSVTPGAKIAIRDKFYMLSKIQYNHDQRTVTLTPSPLIPTTYTTLLARLGGAL